MSVAYITAGLVLKSVSETTAGARPETGYTQVCRLRSMPDFNDAPNGIEVTELDETEWKQYIQDLRDSGGAKAFHANLTDDLLTKWAALVTAYNTAVAAGKEVWFEISHPKLNKSFFFCGEPAPMGFGGGEVSNALEVDCYITPHKIIGWQDKST